MSEKPEDGGPAFPLFTPDGHFNGSVSESGMTSREYFAAHCPITFTEFMKMENEIAPRNGTTQFQAYLDSYAELRMRYATAMLKARRP